MFLWFLSLKLLILTCVPIGFAINSETFLTVSLKKSRFLFMTLKAGTFWLFFSLMKGPLSTLFERAPSQNYSSLESQSTLDGVLSPRSATERSLKLSWNPTVLFFSVSVEEFIVTSDACIESRQEFFFISLMTFLILMILLILALRFNLKSQLLQIRLIRQKIQCGIICQNISYFELLYIHKNLLHYEARDKRALLSLCGDVSRMMLCCGLQSFILKMREEVSNQSGQQDSSDSSRREKIDKKRKIRKEKTQPTIIDFSDLKSIDTKKLSREEKAKVQKAKNREAAQKSRDQHRQYVKKLEDEVQMLRQLSSRRLCWKCRQELEDISATESHLSQSHSFDPTKKMTSSFCLQHEELSNQINFPFNNTSNDFEEQLFLRTEEEQQNSFSYLKLGLFVMAVVIAVVCLQSTPMTQSRALMVVPHGQNDLNQVLTINKPELPVVDNKDESYVDKNKTAIVKIERNQRGLIALNSDDCLKSLITAQQQPKSDPKKSLTSYSDHSSSQTYLNPQEAVILCHLPKPPTLTQRLSNLRAPLVRLYLLGSQIKDLISNFNLMIPIRDNSQIQTNSIYQVLARIKQVNMVTNHNCLL